MLGLLLDACGLCICISKFCNCPTILLFYDTICVRMDYPCMYLCIYFYKTCTMFCVQIYGRKSSHWISISFFLLKTVLLYFAA